MKKTFIGITCLAVGGVLSFVGGVSAQNIANYMDQGGATWHIGSGGDLQVDSGGTIDIESGGTLEIAGVAITATPAEINKLAGVTAGTATASKAAVLGANKDLDTIRINDLLKLNPTDTEPASAEGNLYWDDSENALKVYSGASWVALSAGSGDNTLDDAYDQGGAGAGRTITADTGAVVITNTDADAAFVLSLTPTPGSAAALGGLNITSGANSTEDAIQINNSGSGSDIQGSGSLWNISKAGVGTFADVQATTATVSGVLTASGGVTLANGGTVTNDTNNEIEFTENSEEFALAFSSNTITLETDTLIDTLAFGVIDDLTGIGTVAFDAAAASISLAADGAADDLTIQVTGAQNSSLVLASAGTGADAMQLETTAGGIDITNGGAAAGEDLDVSSTNASVNITAGESATDSIVVSSTIGGIDITAAAAGAGEDIDITANGSSVNVTATESAIDSIVISSSNGGIDITAAAAAAGEDIDISAVGSSVNISATEAIEDAIVINANADGAGINISAQNDIDIAMTNGAAGEDITISNTGGSVNLSATEDIADAVTIAATTGGVDITADGAAASDLDLVCTNGSANLSGGEDAADAIVLSAGAGGIDISAVGEATQDIDITNTGGSVNVTATENAANAIYVHANGGTTETIKIHADQGDTVTSIEIVSDDGGITIDAGADDDINVTSPLDVDDAIVGDGGGAISGMLQTVTNDADGKTVAIAESQTAQTNAGAIGGGIWNLPEASTAIGAQFTFVCMAAQNLDVNPDNADQILGLASAAGDAIRNATAGNTVTLLAVDATNWVVVSSYGTWTDVN